MRQLELSKTFTLMEPGPVVLVTTHDEKKANIVTISWTMVMDFPPVFAITTGEWNFSLIPHARRSARFTLLVTERSSSTGAGLTGRR
ncbi:MAG: hypothetical protein K9K62_07895 [Desulfobacteraceae bacterium]|nr:hypothetical protein [Desulfobacteraceae bacterium]